MRVRNLISIDIGLYVSLTQRFAQLLFDQDWGVINIITCTDTLNSTESFILLVSGLSRKDMEYMGSRLPSIYLPHRNQQASDHLW